MNIFVAATATAALLIIILLDFFDAFNLHLLTHLTDSEYTGGGGWRLTAKVVTVFSLGANHKRSPAFHTLVLTHVLYKGSTLQLHSFWRHSELYIYAQLSDNQTEIGPIIKDVAWLLH